MNQMQLHDMYNEATDRRHRDAEEWARSRSLRRDASSAKSRSRKAPSRRMRLVAVASPMALLGALLASSAIG
jgi:hypothetical protein